MYFLTLYAFMTLISIDTYVCGDAKASTGRVIVVVAVVVSYDVSRTVKKRLLGTIAYNVVEPYQASQRGQEVSWAQQKTAPIKKQSLNVLECSTLHKGIKF